MTLTGKTQVVTGRHIVTLILREDTSSNGKTHSDIDTEGRHIVTLILREDTILIDSQRVGLVVFEIYQWGYFGDIRYRSVSG